MRRSPHREDVQAAIRAAVKRVLHRRELTASEVDAVLEQVMSQAKALYADWPLAA